MIDVVEPMVGWLVKIGGLLCAGSFLDILGIDTRLHTDFLGW